MCRSSMNTLHYRHHSAPQRRPVSCFPPPCTPKISACPQIGCPVPLRRQRQFRSPRRTRFRAGTTEEQSQHKKQRPRPKAPLWTMLREAKKFLSSTVACPARKLSWFQHQEEEEDGNARSSTQMTTVTDATSRHTDHVTDDKDSSSTEQKVSEYYYSSMAWEGIERPKKAKNEEEGKIVHDQTTDKDGEKADHLKDRAQQTEMTQLPSTSPPPLKSRHRLSTQVLVSLLQGAEDEGGKKRLIERIKQIKKNTEQERDKRRSRRCKGDPVASPKQIEVKRPETGRSPRAASTICKLQDLSVTQLCYKDSDETGEGGLQLRNPPSNTLSSVEGHGSTATTMFRTREQLWASDLKDSRLIRAKIEGSQRNLRLLRPTVVSVPPPWGSASRELNAQEQPHSMSDLLELAAQQALWEAEELQRQELEDHGALHNFGERGDYERRRRLPTAPRRRSQPHPPRVWPRTRWSSSDAQQQPFSTRKLLSLGDLWDGPQQNHWALPATNQNKQRITSQFDLEEALATIERKLPQTEITGSTIENRISVDCSFVPILPKNNEESTPRHMAGRTPQSPRRRKSCSHHRPPSRTKGGVTSRHNKELTFADEERMSSADLSSIFRERHSYENAFGLHGEHLRLQRQDGTSETRRRQSHTSAFQHAPRKQSSKEQRIRNRTTYYYDD
ncbi:unnamed protein product [Cyprideis torosa]|uniref:Uncharacterized protein n=1 Tax=Cyprideis torosa TaxID=163714 RepID=A0A7R8W9N9_9CRUS|nr:unnamed protein product [Cyprideis torosa]CAG0884594.1 unnamed protein product [Cyprideis torosa]